MTQCSAGVVTVELLGLLVYRRVLFGTGVSYLGLLHGQQP
ncbi:Unknown protein sequence [Pseudomonas amygdali pv. lachrymans]|uniref:Uncharacterized protein n=1 Tax=Pseudomonas amygdali pv. lachrymans TaxID=53707 RepID=A0ABR5L1G6_PSEAV|nr:Unknown protein sequence [Pseudomonas amygdali pv. lachrymans]KPC21843.1 Unknown protein sequence [Pseudomonas amygdali pv. lachrymans]